LNIRLPGGLNLISIDVYIGDVKAIHIWRFKDYKNIFFLFLSRATCKPSVSHTALNIMCLSKSSGFQAYRQYNIEQCDESLNKNSIM